MVVSWPNRPPLYVVVAPISEANWGSGKPRVRNSASTGSFSMAAIVVEAATQSLTEPWPKMLCPS